MIVIFILQLLIGADVSISVQVVSIVSNQPTRKLRIRLSKTVSVKNGYSLVVAGLISLKEMLALAVKRLHVIFWVAVLTLNGALLLTVPL